MTTLRSLPRKSRAVDFYCSPRLLKLADVRSAQAPAVLPEAASSGETWVQKGGTNPVRAKKTSFQVRGGAAKARAR